MPRGVPRPRRAKSPRAASECGAVGFVCKKDGFDSAFAQEGGDFLVSGGEAVLAIDEEEDEVGLAEGQIDLMADVVGQLVGIDEAEAAGVDEFDPAVADLEGGGDAIARDSWGILDDADELVGEPVEKAAFADVGAADDRDYGEILA